jgi:hypothetical protein
MMVFMDVPAVGLAWDVGHRRESRGFRGGRSHQIPHTSALWQQREQAEFLGDGAPSLDCSPKLRAIQPSAEF